MKTIIYLSSPTTNVDHAEIYGWRDTCKNFCKSRFQFEDASLLEDGLDARNSVERSLKLLRKCDMLAVRLTREDIRLGVEMAYARAYGLDVHVIIEDENMILDPTLIYLADQIHPSVEDFLNFIKIYAY